MKKAYKEVYDLVNKLGYSPDYIRFKNGVYSLLVYPLNYNIYKDSFFNFQDVSLEGLKERLVEELKPLNDTHPSLNEMENLLK